MSQSLKPIRYEWETIPWKTIQVKVFKLQKRIYQAAKQGNASPDDGNWTYWSQRKGSYPGVSQTVGMTLRKQNGKCAECGLHFHPDDRVEIHHHAA